MVDEPQKPAPLNTLYTEENDTPAETEPASAKGSRRLARMAAVQALYQWLVAAGGVSAIVRQFKQKERLKRADAEFFEAAVYGVAEDRNALEDTFSGALSRPVSQLDPVEHAILLLGAYELRDRPEIPYSAVINEACEVAKIYGAEGSYKFINGVLDKVAKAQRPHEPRRR